ncbi:hypothetical protein QTJ04_02380 [Clostridium perfringens]|uniref:hypothetical protein n=1 Tax=Clostridium perfringens TaxID=1502 RepID=UPI0013E31F16|nr:hypothetical protein [Clostridium perfringens]MCX0410942.1 hypothetical protein [Clostridium perfringens]MDM1005096.1 hypothetical protein [Clostridium perfringens]MDT9335678.1 hypothetical protein [Clostridium perfringens]MDT9343435.1 hypothetical protein [Clostridium perfringens]MDT9346616.1 hypothetical protein [Clostridium perfringens]
MENEKQNKLGAGIITISAIELVFSVLLILGLILFLIPSFLELAGLSLDQMGISHITIFIRLVATLLNILGIILILRKKAIGLYIYLLITAANIIYSIIMNGFMISSLIGSLILPVLMTFFVYRKKELFGLSK